VAPEVVVVDDVDVELGVVVGSGMVDAGVPVP
jgi:hypothetical protein